MIVLVMEIIFINLKGGFMLKFESHIWKEHLKRTRTISLYALEHALSLST